MNTQTPFVKQEEQPWDFSVGKPYYELLAEMNGLPPDFDTGVDLAYSTQPHITPNLTEDPEKFPRAWFRKHGMQAQRIRLCRFHWGFMEMFDGDIEEAEKIFDRITGWAGWIKQHGQESQRGPDCGQEGTGGTTEYAPAVA